jgi:4a-hydroxytetrahydrobiopterin dehydratase
MLVRSVVSLLLASRSYCSHSFPFVASLTTIQQRRQPASTMATCSAPGKCVPCEGLDHSALLSVETVQERLLKEYPLWKLTNANNDDDNEGPMMMSRKFVAKNFQAALDSINAMGAIAEEQGHHPDFHLTSYRNVEVTLWTHSLGGLTENDLTLAKLLDGVPVTYSPKWLKENPAAQKEE